MKKMLIALVCLGVLVSYASQQTADIIPQRNLDQQTLKEQDRLRTIVPERDASSGAPNWEGRYWLIAEDFESGMMPAGWKVVDGNGDGTTWMVGTTSDLLGMDPPSYGTAYAYYSDDDAGSGAPIGTEYLIAPGKDCSTFGTMGLDYDWGFQDYIGGPPTGECHVRYFKNTTMTWTGWKVLFSVTVDANGHNFHDLTADLVNTDSIQIRFIYDDPGPWWGYAFGVDNVFLGTPPVNEVACTDVVSPVGKLSPPGNFNVTGRIQNFGSAANTFWVHGKVWETPSMTLIYEDSTQLVNFPSGGDQNVTISQVACGPDKYFYTEIWTDLPGDEDPSNDMSSAASRTALGFGDIILEMDVNAPTGDLYIVGMEFDGTNFYVTGANAFGVANVYVLDLAGNLIWTIPQMPWTWGGWGWRDMCDDGSSFYASAYPFVDEFTIDVSTGVLTYMGSFPGPLSTQRAMGYDPFGDWFFTGDFSNPIYTWKKDWSAGYGWYQPFAMYGCGFDTDYDSGGWTWWHSQDGVYPQYLQVEEFDFPTGTFRRILNYSPALQGGGYAVAGGACFYEGYQNWDMLFLLVQGTPDEIVGMIIRPYVPMADATIDFYPNTLNLGSGGTYIKCYIEPEIGYDANDIDASSVRIEKIDGSTPTGGAIFTAGPSEVGDYDSDGILDLMVKFYRQDVIDGMGGIVTPPAIAYCEVRGDFTYAADFAGTGAMRVINPQVKHDATMGSEIPVAFALYEISPNPFNAHTVIRYALPTNSHVNLNIYDASGRIVKSLVNTSVGAGYHNVNWDGRDNMNRRVASGVYFLKFETENYKESTKLLLVR